eukprot:601677-Hanusia_phi.AAC.2
MLSLSPNNDIVLSRRLFIRMLTRVRNISLSLPVTSRPKSSCHVSPLQPHSTDHRDARPGSAEPQAQSDPI